MLKCSHIYKKYGDCYVLCDRNDTFHTGFYLLLGASGSGKTTYLNVLYGIIEADAGKICYEDQVFDKKADIQFVNRFAEYIPQEPCFADFLTAKENLKIVCEDDSLIGHYVDQFHLSGVINNKTSVLSGGERQRLAIIRALLSKKRILFLDEPTAALDVENKILLFEVLKELKTETLILCASHDEVARQYADHTLFFEKKNPDAEVQMEVQEQASDVKNKSLPKTSRQKPNFRNTNLRPFLAKKMKSELKKEKMAFFVFLTIAFLFFMFADLPVNKMHATRNNVYHYNMLSVYVYEGVDLAEKVDTSAVKNIEMDYAGSCPQPDVFWQGGSELILPSQDEEIKKVITIPYQKELFYLADRIKYGSYYQDVDQIILTYEMALELNRSHPEKLIGKKIKKNIYGIGDVEFEIVGIFDELCEEDACYLDQYATNRQQYNSEYFINSEFVKRLSEDPTLYRSDQNGKKRLYHLYFDDYYELLEYEKNIEQDEDYGKDFEILFVTDNPQLYAMFEMTFPVLLFLSLSIGLLSLIFIIYIQKLKMKYDHPFVSVFEQCGYNKKRVINTYMGLVSMRNMKICICAMGLSGILAFFINILNGRLHFLHFQVFTFQWFYLFGYVAVLTLISVIYNYYCFHSLQICSWYENMISKRDLL